MATELLSDEHSPGIKDLNLSTEGATKKSTTESRTMIEPVAGAETMIGKMMIGETLIGEAMMGAAFVETVLWGGPETILLVEDEAFVRKVTAEVLESAGYKLVIAKSATEALEAYRSCSQPVDLLLADVVMPGMSGRELAFEFERLHPRARVLLMSGYAEQLALCESSPYRKLYMAKPFSIRLLLKRVREVLDTNPFDCGAPAWLTLVLRYRVA
jgi:CheY-like chemotaxis protein